MCEARNRFETVSGYRIGSGSVPAEQIPPLSQAGVLRADMRGRLDSI
jgi:hypothetical protein